MPAERRRGPRCISPVREARLIALWHSFQAGEKGRETRQETRPSQWTSPVLQTRETGPGAFLGPRPARGGVVWGSAGTPLSLTILRFTPFSGLHPYLASQQGDDGLRRSVVFQTLGAPPIMS